MSYRFRRTTAGNSTAYRAPAALLKAYPIFDQEELKVDVVGDRVLVLTPASSPGDPIGREEDPVLEAYLAFLEKEMRHHPERIRPLDADLVALARDLVGHIPVELDEAVDNDATLP